MPAALDTGFSTRAENVITNNQFNLDKSDIQADANGVVHSDRIQRFFNELAQHSVGERTHFQRFMEPETVTRQEPLRMIRTTDRRTYDST